MRTLYVALFVALAGCGVSSKIVKESTITITNQAEGGLEAVGRCKAGVQQGCTDAEARLQQIMTVSEALTQESAK